METETFITDIFHAGVAIYKLALKKKKKAVQTVSYYSFNILKLREKM